jgi:hypothetical protein
MVTFGAGGGVVGVGDGEAVDVGVGVEVDSAQPLRMDSVEKLRAITSTNTNSLLLFIPNFSFRKPDKSLLQP